MDDKEFTANYLTKIKEVLRFALENPYCDFYRRKYAGHDIEPENINSYDDFQKIPHLTKDELLELPLENRLFCPEENVDYFVSSSGTQGQPLIVGSFWEHAQAKVWLDAGELKQIGVNKILLLNSPKSPSYPRILANPQKGLTITPGDPHKLDLAALSANAININGIISTPTILYLFCQELQKTNFDFKNIRWISLSSEKCLESQLAYFKAIFPKAWVNFRYGASESTTLRGYQCQHLDGGPANHYHPTPFVFLETAGGQEIIYTDLDQPRVFPMIRYRTGDFGKIKNINCPCGARKLLELEGRSETDLLKFHGVILHTKIIADAVAKAPNLAPIFQMHVYEEQKNGRPVPRLKLMVAPKNGEAIPSGHEIARIVTQNLYLASDKNLDYFIKKELFLPLEIEISPELLSPSQKIKFIVSHLK